ncbi:MAG: tRNA (guanosine(37)-N1)-methyltransferase TrmD [Gammaproteobacteria bacterium]|nr:tRNA (guanosine(37)-N1)-methyltransferase TrmD [Gammaproteobacteria bacterium]NIR84759.1 tRNA (guanosine(37)-N1)-methyltransferase TrmD [Gammaproteobacteria bacterium]NIR91255.1 tRNA (guanosine(37)-N1)-methyltransferase TrmD [Gammaproteobacteria bacterium]NIU05802.1 tRNA (guanosine(37)-N1)-methyltransferase TrmD [Gammaproteobacteria bacterium]NIV52921.1 tRNA (guanosine(37)-N1)-methyltransferase TrmD [Gammaproteobacteria bacterium]
MENAAFHAGVVSIFPEMFDAVTRWGVTGRAVERGVLRLDLWNPRDFATDRHRTVDDRPYGGGPGMVMMAPPLRAAVQAAKASVGADTPVIHLTPQGRRLDQRGVETLAERRRLVMICGRYEGIDERLIESEVDEEWSVGDYVLSGGELAAMVILDAVIRCLPGALGHDESAKQDSFAVDVLDCAHYTRPEEFGGRRVPAVLLTGNHEQIRRWRLKQALGRTWLRRPDLLAGMTLDAEQRALLDEFVAEHETGGDRTV